MTNQQGAPEALLDPSPDQLRAIARTARNSSGSASDDCGPLAYVLHGWRAAVIAFRAQQAALVEAQQPATHVQNPAEIEHVAGDVSKNGAESNMAQQPAPSAAAATEVENLRKALQFYADKDHFNIADEGAWDTVSGEPQNYWCDEEGTATVEDGTIARLALAGHQIKFDADEAPQPTPTPQTDSQPAPAVGYPPLPRVGAIGYASVVDIDSYAKTLTIGPHLPGVRDIALWTTDQMRAYVDAERVARAPADSVTAPAGATNTKTEELLSTTVGLLMGYREGGSRQPYKPGSVIAKTVDEVVEHLKNWPYPEPTHAADSVLEDAARWQALPAFFEEYQIDAMKLYRDIDAYLAAARKEGGAT